MNAAARLDTVDADGTVMEIARRHLGSIRASRSITWTARSSSPDRRRIATTSSTPMRGRVSSRISTRRSSCCLWWHLLHRRFAAATQLAGGTRAESPGAHRRDRTQARFRDGEPGLGVRVDDRSKNRVARRSTSAPSSTAQSGRRDRRRAGRCRAAGRSTTRRCRAARCACRWSARRAWLRAAP